METKYILIIESDPGLQWVLKSCLKQADWEIVTINNLDDAWIICKSVRFDLIIAEFFHWPLRCEQDIPVIGIVNKDHGDPVFTRTIVKPFKVEDMKKIVKELLGG